MIIVRSLILKKTLFDVLVCSEMRKIINLFVLTLLSYIINNILQTNLLIINLIKSGRQGSTTRTYCNYYLLVVLLCNVSLVIMHEIF